MIIKFQPITLCTCKTVPKEPNITKRFCPSNIPAWALALKDSISVIAKRLCFLMNRFSNESKFPNDLKQAHVCPIFKKGDTEDPNNYRPIPVTAALSKDFRKSFVNKILNILLTTNFFPGTIWFQKIISTTDALVFTTEKIRKEIDNNHFVAAGF